MAALARLNLSGPVHSSHLNHWLIWRLGERFQVNFVWEFAAGERHT
jgi:hypothetical protein